MSKLKVIFYTFGSEGPPHDQGLSLIEGYADIFCQTVLESGVDEAYWFCPRTLGSFIGEEKAKKCTQPREKPIVEICKSHHNVGMGAWKAEILKEAAKRNRDGDIIMFHDINWKRSNFLEGFGKNARDYATAAVSICDIFTPVHLTLNHTITRRNYEYLRDKNILTTKASRVALMPSSRVRCIVVKLNDKTRDFLNKYADACENLDLLRGDGNKEVTGGWIFPGFIHNSGEQAIFNGLIYGRGIWDAERDKWQNDLQDCASSDEDTGFKRIAEWAEKNRGWKSDRT